MITKSNDPGTAKGLVGAGLQAHRQPWWALVLVLAAPSVYFFCCFPPLWRDSDGFFQLASGINEITIIHWPPLYCLTARVFLLIGALIEGVLHGMPGRFHWSFGKPTFTDTGTYVLLAVQHLLLVTSLLVTVVTLTGRFWVRLALAAGFALNSSWYAFAHCVGTEAFSNPLTLLVFAAGLTVFRKPNRSAYAGYALAFGGAALSRPINSVLAGLVPGALLLAAAVHWILHNHRQTGNGRPAVALFRQAATCTIIGIMTIAATGLLIHGLCWVKRVPYRSRIGYTFMWRLNYLAGLTPAQRTETLQRVDGKLHDPITARALAAAIGALDQNPYWDTHTLYYGISDALSQEGITRQRTLNLETDQRLDRLARAFLVPPDPALKAAIVHDFLAGFRFTPADVSAEPFRGTDWLQARLDLPSFAPIRALVTFKDKPSHEARWHAAPYLRLWAWIPLWALGLAALAIGTFLLCRQTTGARLDPPFLIISSVVTGAVLYFLNCSLTFLAARFLLPVEILFWCALSLALASLLEIPRMPQAEKCHK
jgi:hypothetical protein